VAATDKEEAISLRMPARTRTPTRDANYLKMLDMTVKLTLIITFKSRRELTLK
jgi:hypothetical protein